MKVLSVLVVLGGLIACDESGVIGEDFVGDQVVDVVLIDTLTVHLSTLVFDSISTINSERLLVGYQRDDSLGLTVSKAYFRLDQNSATGFPDDDAHYNYTEFELVYDDYYYYDTIPPVNLTLVPLVEELEVNDDDNNLYNVDSFNYDLDSALFSQEILFFPCVSLLH